MGIYSGYLICTDLDGTFVNKKSELIEKNLKAVEKFMENGGLFTVSTGRAASYLKEKYGDRLKINTYLICVNGTMLCDRDSGEILYSNVLNKKAIADVSGFLNMVEVTHFYTEKGAYDTLEEIPEEESLYKVVFKNKTEEDCFFLKGLLEEKFGETCDFNRSWPEGLEMLAKGAGKGDCIRKLRKILGDRVNTVIGVGDFENDITMLSEADIGVAVGNALPSVKAVANKVTVSNEEGALAKIIEEL